MLGDMTSDASKALLLVMNGAVEDAQEMYGNPFYNLFATSIQNASTNLEKSQLMTRFADTMRNSTVDQLKTMWNDINYREALIGLFGEERYSQIGNMFSTGIDNIDAYVSEFENQGRLFGIRFSEGLTNPTVMDGVADAYEKLLLDPMMYDGNLES